MVEPEIAFADLRDDMRCAEDFVTFCVRKALADCSAELDFLENHTGGEEKGKKIAPVTAAGTRKRLEAIAAADSPGFARVSYTEAVEILREHIAAKKVKFELPVEWGVDLASEHERYLTDVVHEGRPVIVYDYPKEIKAFYMRVSFLKSFFFSFSARKS
jgi:asparaginyl-tRNA synthetase